MGRPAGRRAGEAWAPLSAARWLRGQKRGRAGLGKPPSAGLGPASPTQRPGNLKTFHCLRSFPKQIVPITMGLRRHTDNWGVGRPEGRAHTGGARCPEPASCGCDRKPGTARAPGERRAQRRGASRSRSLRAEPLAARPREGAVKPRPLRFRVSKGRQSSSGGLLGEREFLERPGARLLAPSAVFLNICQDPILQRGGWRASPPLCTELTLPYPRRLLSNLCQSRTPHLAWHQPSCRTHYP